MQEIGSINKPKTFIIVETHKLLPYEYKIISYHLIFDAKFDGRKKDRIIAGRLKVKQGNYMNRDKG